MGVDLSVYRNFLAAPKSVADYDNEFAQNQINMLDLRQKRQAAADDKLYRETARNFGTDSAANANALRLAGLPTQASAYEKAVLDAQKTRTGIALDESKAREADANVAEKARATQQAKYKEGMQILTTASSPEQAARMINDGVRKGYWSMQDAQQKIGEMQQHPDFQQWRTGELHGLMSANDRLELERKQAADAAMKKFHDDSIAATVRGQDVSAATSRANNRDTIAAENARAATGVTYQQDANGNLIALPSKIATGAGPVRGSPVLGGDGKPVQGKSSAPAATEDERKAAGWYAQADNAWQNMQAAMGGVDPKTGEFRKPGVARPGFPDAVAAIPSFGLGEVVGNTMRGADRQRFNQASSSLSEALLRAATGAGVNKDEAMQKVRELTPVFGEASETTKQKMASIPMYLNSLKQRAGRAMPAASQPQAQGGTVDFGSLK